MGEVLFRGGCVLTMDPELGDFGRGDVHVKDGRIHAVGVALDAPGAEIIEAEGRIVLPGLIDGHRHTWQSLLRGVAADWSFLRYMTEARALYCGCFDAEDAYIANYLGGLESLNAGITSIVDHCHLQSTPEVSDALARGLKDSGIGGIFCYALQNVPYYVDETRVTVAEVKDTLFRDPDLWHDGHAAQLRDAYFSDGPLRFGVALPEIAAYVPSGYSAQIMARARALQPSLVTGHWNATFREGAYHSTLPDLVNAGAFETKTLLSHFNLASDADLHHMIRADIGLCTCPDVEAGMGLGPLLARHFVSLGGEACLGLDVTCFVGADMLAQARMLLQLERKELSRDLTALPLEIGYPTRAALELLTSTAARAIGQGDEIGSLTPGKRADIIVVGPDPIHAAPLADPVATLLFHTAVSDVEIVMVAGNIVKRAGKLTNIDVDALRTATREAAARVQARYERLPKAALQTVWEGVF